MKLKSFVHARRVLSHGYLICFHDEIVATSKLVKNRFSIKVDVRLLLNQSN